MSTNTTSAEPIPAKPTILIVDDTPNNLEVVRNILIAQGYTATTAISGDRAIKRLHKHVPNLILLDVQMPGIDGFETCQQIKQNPHWAKIPIIFLTALTDTDNIVKGFALGAVDYISKPFQEAELLARVETHLRIDSLTKHLEHTLGDLKKTQAQLIQAEKMSSLGQMVAGVAHEINNPISFIKGNLTPLGEHFSDVKGLLTLYQREYPHPSPSIQEKQEAIDLNFLMKDLENILRSLDIGSDRIKKIVLSLRNFSRLDESLCKEIDIHTGLDSTLSVLQHRLKATEKFPKINIIREYVDLPRISCHPRHLNQVFLHIINNAVDALRSPSDQTSQTQALQTQASNAQASNAQANANEAPKILIRTEDLKNHKIRISISNTGSPIPEADQKRIFDPFFTTKSVGEGSGLGLFVSYSIVQEHGGSITVSSQPEIGTSFNVILPYSSELSSTP